eukprot:3630003-Amphidinium_carterae.1
MMVSLLRNMQRHVQDHSGPQAPPFPAVPAVDTAQCAPLSTSAKMPRGTKRTEWSHEQWHRAH